MAFKTALIVDDSKLARVTLKKKLESHGLLVEMVDSAEQAYQSLPSINPDIIFMDHLMPGIDGFEATQHIRQMPDFAQTPIVMCTGKDHDGYLQEALAIGANFILSKPPVDEALDAILAVDELAAVVPVAEPQEATDVADFMGEHDELAEHHQPVAIDLAPMPEADVADFMAAMDKPAETAPVIMPSVLAGINADEVERICARIINHERAAIIHDVLASVPVPAAPAVVVPDAGDIERICADVIARAHASIVSDVLARLPAPVAAAALPEADMSSILSTVNAAVSHQLAVNTSTLKTSITEEIQQNIGSIIAGTMERDMQGLLDLRLSALVAEKFAQTNGKLASLEQQFNDKIRVQEGLSTDAAEPLLTLQQPAEGVGSRVAQLQRLEQVYEEQVQLREKLRVLQKLVIVAGGLGVVAIAVALLTGLL